MKKFFILSVLLALAISASAKIEFIYAYQYGTDNFYMRYRIDRDEKMFYFDGDSECDTEMLMKNYKKSGNKETFDIYAKCDGKKVGSVVLIIDPSLKGKDDLSSQTMTVKAYGSTQKYNVKNEKQEDSGSKGSDSGDENIVDKAKNKANVLFNKGKNLFKKKK